MSGLIVPYLNKTPIIDPSAWIAPNATLIGDVEIGANCGIWYNVVLRGDSPGIKIGDGSNIQDGAVIHVSFARSGTTVGKNVTVGHMALLHACTIEDDSFVGMHSTVLDDVVVETGAMVAAGAVVTPGKRVKRGELWAGSPAKLLRQLTDKELAYFPYSAKHYCELAAGYLTAEA